jgi:hypothetical protein
MLGGSLGWSCRKAVSAGSWGHKAIQPTRRARGAVNEARAARPAGLVRGTPPIHPSQRKATFPVLSRPGVRRGRAGRRARTPRARARPAPALFQPF